MSSTPVTVTVWAVFQLAGVKVRVAGAMVASAVSLLETLTVNKENQALQKLLSIYHPKLGKTYREFKPQAIAVDQFDNFLRAWEKEYYKDNPKKKPKKKSKKKSKKDEWKPRIEDVAQHCSLDEIRDMLLDDKDLTKQERFDYKSKYSK